MDRARFDQMMMRNALAMGRRGLGSTAPNPSVGAIIADTSAETVIARGWTRAGGRPHAETIALEHAGSNARSATLYVTLEPCNHHGGTPPCTDAIIEAGIKRVVVGVQDPDPRVAGQGMARLREAGLVVQGGLLGREARWQTLGHALRVTRHRPFVQLKLAVARDGSVPRGRNRAPSWVTGALARAWGHMLRAEADAILVGSKTVAEDDPDLTCRLPGMAHRSPVRIVLASDASIPLDARCLRSARTVPLCVIASAESAGNADPRLEAAGAEILAAASSQSGGLDVADVLDVLAGRGVTRLLVEGGPSVWAAFAQAGVVDEIMVFLGSGTRNDDADAPPAKAVEAVQTLLDLDPGPVHDHRRLAGDDLFVFRLSERADGVAPLSTVT